MTSTLNTIQLQERGVFVQASTLGSLEALLTFLKQSKIPVRLQTAVVLLAHTVVSLNAHQNSVHQKCHTCSTITDLVSTKFSVASVGPCINEEEG